MLQIFAILSYFLAALGVGVISYRKQTSSASFLIGNRSLNYWLTALAAHASDMSNWLFMAYPATIFTNGLFNSWVAIGLVFCMLLNWQWVAPKIRVLSAQTNSLTLSDFFEKRLGDQTGYIRIFSAAICLLFYTIYIAAGLVGLGNLTESLFGIHYAIGIGIGIIIVVSYSMIGGFVTLAWLDLFQGLFLLGVIVMVPLFILPKVGGLAALSIKSSLIPSLHRLTLFHILTMSLGWGLGYFGQPHIITKFMGIRDVNKIHHSKWIGMSWMVLSLAAATFVGLIGSAFFTHGISDPEMVFIEIVKQNFSPFMTGFILCALIAAIINVVSSQLLVISSILSVDFYKNIIHKKASEKRLILISRLGILGVSLLAFGVAFINPASIFELVLYAWSGLGAAFGPLLLYTLYGKKLSCLGAWVGMVSGALIAAIWPTINNIMCVHIEPLLPAFLISLALNWGISQFNSPKA